MKISSLVYKLLGEEESTALLLLSLFLQPVQSKKHLHVWEANSVLFVGFLANVLLILTKSTGTKTETTLHCSAAYTT
jgi:hypothetical protein